MIKIGCASDLHGNWDIPEDPKVELLILAGDLCSSDVVTEQEREIKEKLGPLLSRFPGLQETVIIPGNHDYLLERIYKDSLDVRNLLGYGVTLLVDEEYTYLSSLNGEEVRLYGCPRCDLYSFAFPHLPGLEDIRQIPEGLDILVTHEAPRDYRIECIKVSQGWYDGDKPGSQALGVRVKEVKPKYHVFGHIHHPCVMKGEYTTSMNVSQLKGRNIKQELYIIEYEK